MTIKLLAGDCRDVLKELPSNSIHMVCTSPPYYGLRNYGVDRQIGLEPTPDAYLAEMVAVFREVKRVLRPDGTCWVNMGDSYAAGHGGRDTMGRGSIPRTGSIKPGSVGNAFWSYQGENTPARIIPNVKPKDLLMMPARLALALQADGWWLRSDIIWHKPNPMPESVTDRPTSAHEHVFLLTRSPRYFYDASAIAEPSEASSLLRLGQDVEQQAGSLRANGGTKTNGAMKAVGGSTRACRNVWTIATAPLSSAFSGGSYRIASRDCVAHDRQADLAHVLECDARQDVFQFGRNPGKRSRPAELPEGAVVSIPVDRSAFPAGVTSAIGHSNQTHRTPSLSERDVIFADIPSGHTECRALLDHSFAMSARTPASNTSPGASPDAPLSCQSVESPDRIVGIATYEPRPAGCSCYYAGTVHKRQDHFASFPPALAERCIRAGTSERGCCAACGAPWGRITETDYKRHENWFGDKQDARHSRGKAGTGYNEPIATRTTGWAPSCACGAAVVPCTVLDPFAGAGTTLLVADRLQRDAIGVELNPDYTRMAMARCRDDAPLFASPPPADAPEEPSIRDLFA